MVIWCLMFVYVWLSTFRFFVYVDMCCVSFEYLHTPLFVSCVFVVLVYDVEMIEL